MPTFERGDMFSVWGKTDLFLFTSNPIVNKQGLAVMGRGIAKQLSDKVPTIRKAFADYLKRSSGEYAVADLGEYTIGTATQRVGYFMVKAHWADPASLRIIEESVDCLIAILVELQWFSEVVDDAPFNFRVDLNFPGIGNGKLQRDDVLPLLLKLPDYVHIWEYDNGQ